MAADFQSKYPSRGGQNQEVNITNRLQTTSRVSLHRKTNVTNNGVMSKSSELVQRGSTQIGFRNREPRADNRKVVRCSSLPRLDLLTFKEGRSHVPGRMISLTSLSVSKEHSKIRRKRNQLERVATWQKDMAFPGQQAPPSSGMEFIDWTLLKQRFPSSPRSKEHQLVLEELTSSNSLDSCSREDVLGQSSRHGTMHDTKRKVSKRWSSARIKLKSTSVFMNKLETNTTTTRRSSRGSIGPITSQSHIDEVLPEEIDSFSSNGIGKDSLVKVKSKLKPKSRGWKIVKNNLSRIVEMLPRDSIDSRPMQFTNIAQIVRAKQFRLMMQRRASFIENGIFRFEEAKRDLYKRYDRPNNVNTQ